MEQQNQEQQLTKQQLAEFNKQQRAAAQRRKEEKEFLREQVSFQELEIKYMENMMYLPQLREQFKKFIDALHNPPVKMQDENTDIKTDTGIELPGKES
jgi:hypothetical protein